MSMKRAVIISLVIGIFYFCITGCSLKKISNKPDEEPQKVEVNGKPISKFESTFKTDKPIVVSPDNKRIGYVLNRNKREYAVIDSATQYMYKEISGKRIIFSPDSKRSAYVATNGEKKIAVIDGTETGSYNFIGEDAVYFSPDSRRTALTVEKEDGSWTIVIDGKEEGSYPRIVRNVFFSPDSKRIAFNVKTMRFMVPVIDGKEGEQFFEIKYGIVFSPDSRKAAFIAVGQDRDSQYISVYVDGKPLEKFERSYLLNEKSILKWDSFLEAIKERTTRPIERVWTFLDPESKKIIEAWEPGKTLDDKSKSVIIKGLNNIIMASDFYSPKEFVSLSLDRNLKKIALRKGMKGAKKQGASPIRLRMFNRGLLYSIFPDDIEEMSNDIKENSLVFSPDSRRVAYTVREGSKWFVIIDNTHGKKYDNTGECIIFSPDSKQSAYVAKEGDKEFVVVNGKEGKKYDSIGTNPQFSPVGNDLAYTAMLDEKQFVVINGKEGKKYDSIIKNISTLEINSDRKDSIKEESGSDFSVLADRDVKYSRLTKNAIVFSPDGKQTAYAAEEGDKQFVVINGKEQNKYDSIDSMPVFSPDGKHTAYVASADKKQFVVVDGKELKRYSKIITEGGGRIIFDSAENLRYLVIENDTVYIIEEKI